MKRKQTAMARDQSNGSNMPSSSGEICSNGRTSRSNDKSNSKRSKLNKQNTNDKITLKMKSTKGDMEQSQSQSQSQDEKLLLQVNKRKANASMQSSLSIIRTSLLCPICQFVMKDPSTLQCSHSFCKACISNHTRNSWTCPFPNCQLPVSNRGGSKSYISTNPQLSSVISSLENIVSSLNSASNEWWKELNRQQRRKQQQQQQQQQIQMSPPLHLTSTTKNSTHGDSEGNKCKRNHTNMHLKKNKHNTIFDRIEIETPPPMKKQKNDNDSGDSSSQCSASTTTNERNDNGPTDDNNDGDGDDENKLNLNNNNENDIVEDDDDRTQYYAFEDEETQQQFSIDDEPYSMVEADNVDEDDDDDDDDDGDSGSTTTENDSHGDDPENEIDSKDNKGVNNHDSKIDTGTQRGERLIDVGNHASFIESPSSFRLNDCTKAKAKLSTNSSLEIETAPTILNRSCAIPIGTSPKLSPIALVASQQSVDNDIDNNEDFDGVKSQGQNELSFTSENNSDNNVKELQPKQKSPVSFMDIFNELLQKIDTSHGEEQLSCNNGLLQEYCIYLIGDFDDYFSRTPKKQNTGNVHTKGQGQQIGNASEPQQNTFTRGRICLLLNMCGAQVKDVTSMNTGKTKANTSMTNQTYVIVVPGSNPTTACREQIEYFLKSQTKRRSNRRRDNSGSSFAVVTTQWIFDSIHEFIVRDYDDYVIKDIL